MPATQQGVNLPLGLIGIQGRNGSESSFVVSDRHCLEARNIDWFQSALARKRGGATAIGMTGGTAFSAGARSLFRHVPGFDQTAAEFWAVDGGSAWHRLAAGVVWADITPIDAIQSDPQEVTQVSFNGKSYFAYNNAHNRLHVWDPVDASLRRAGLDLPAVPTTGALIAGAVTKTRKYRVAWTKQRAAITVKRSNLSTATASVTTAAQQVPITRPTLPGEDETHWELYAAEDAAFADYRLISTQVVATATVNDNTATLGATVGPEDGANTPPPSCRYLAADDGRIIMGGAWETAAENAMAPSAFRVWWTSPLNSSTGGDDERVSNTGVINSYADIEEAITGISTPMQLVSAQATSLERGSFYVFSFNAQWKFVSTGESAAPYLRFKITGGRGCIHHKSIVIAEDANGNPTVMWASATGIMRIGTGGQEFMGQDCVDIWKRLNIDATIPCHSVFHPELHQVWFYIAVDGSSYPNFRLVFDTRLGRMTQDTGVRGGWATADGESAKAYCSALFSETIGVAMGRDLKPYIGYTGATAIWQCDTTALTDAGFPFQAYLDSKSYVPWGLGKKGGMSADAMLVANASAGSVVQLTIYRNEGQEAMNYLADLTPRSDSQAETKVFPKFEGSRLSDSYSFRCRIGDPTAVASTWNLDAVIVPDTMEGDA